MNDPIPVFAWFSTHGRPHVWMYSYTAPCRTCGRIHQHGGGDGDVPDLAIGQTGHWDDSHCSHPHASHPVDLVLVRIAPKPVPDDEVYASPLDKAIAKSREWRERTMVPCVICPPHANEQPRRHKTATFHEVLFYDCDVCAPLRLGVPRTHRVRRSHPRRNVQHRFTSSEGAGS